MLENMVQRLMISGGTDNDPDKSSDHYGLWTFKKVWGTYLKVKNW